MYLIALLLALIGLGILDFRYKLALFKHRNRAVKILLIGMVIFINWDIFGIVLDIFFIGKNSVLVGLRVGDFPLEEIFFLALLHYSSLVIYTGIKKVQP